MSETIGKDSARDDSILRDTARCVVEYETTLSAGGPDRTFYYCPGCDKKVIQHHGGKAVIVPKGKDFFDMRETA